MAVVLVLAARGVRADRSQLVVGSADLEVGHVDVAAVVVRPLGVPQLTAGGGRLAARHAHVAEPDRVAARHQALHRRRRVLDHHRGVVAQVAESLAVGDLVAVARKRAEQLELAAGRGPLGAVQRRQVGAARALAGAGALVELAAGGALERSAAETERLAAHVVEVRLVALFGQLQHAVAALGRGVGGAVVVAALLAEGAGEAGRAGRVLGAAEEAADVGAALQLEGALGAGWRAGAGAGLAALLGAVAFLLARLVEEHARQARCALADALAAGLTELTLVGLRPGAAAGVELALVGAAQRAAGEAEGLAGDRVEVGAVALLAGVDRAIAAALGVDGAVGIGRARVAGDRDAPVARAGLGVGLSRPPVLVAAAGKVVLPASGTDQQEHQRADSASPSAPSELHHDFLLRETRERRPTNLLPT